MQSAKIKSQPDSFKNVLSAVKKLSAEEKQLLRLELFAADALSEMKNFESQLKKKKKPVKKTDDEIVSLTTSIRRKKNANTKKMLH
jgi:predicted RNase H-like nuclease